MWGNRQIQTILYNKDKTMKISPYSDSQKRKPNINLMKHSVVPDTRQKYRGRCTSSESNECDG